MESNSRPPESVGDLLGRYSGGFSKTGLKTLGVRLSEQDHLRLDMVAAHFGVPKATFARDLLRAALTEAMASIHFSNPQEQAEFDEEYQQRQVDLHIAQQEEMEGR